MTVSYVRGMTVSYVRGYVRALCQGYVRGDRIHYATPKEVADASAALKAA
jgi:hypothetical protein